jgi:hypothetical protein
MKKQIPSIPDAAPRSHRSRCAGRESNFLAVFTLALAATAALITSAAASITIDYVNVGHAGQPPFSPSQTGSQVYSPRNMKKQIPSIQIPSISLRQ